ncbi:MAG: orotidine-5'-phosphate decarboxylase [Dehalococcoidia bacterium]|nr:orotidine-5'-phosphate decarboxylase [Dehalococcoidia bacterium]MDH4300014.1 orotidine-5'-phosphate decarboxylase [Dehalococcoidia bacterium]MDH4367378.1 orotidine-5'-phosphate decarboxylase [Dehalococcoidia bacterium]
MNFTDKLLDASRKNKSWLCIGLDPDPELMPVADVLQFNEAIIEATSDLVCAYKPNLAFYEALGTEGLAILERMVKEIPGNIPVIGDAKRSDIGNTARAYAKALFSVLGFDAATVNPYLGYDSVEPFISYEDKEVFILCRTSNKGATDFQNLRSDGLPLYEIVARKAREWNIHGNIGLVVGATYPEELKKVRSICPEMPLLIPGIGAQGGDLASAVGYGVDARGEKAIINVSRQILYASKEKDFAQAARNVAEKIRNQVNDYRSKAR